MLRNVTLFSIYSGDGFSTKLFANGCEWADIFAFQICSAPLCQTVWHFLSVANLFAQMQIPANLQMFPPFLKLTLWVIVHNIRTANREKIWFNLFAQINKSNNKKEGCICPALNIISWPLMNRLKQCHELFCFRYDIFDYKVRNLYVRVVNV